MDSPKKVPGLSLASLRRQLHVAETATHDYDFTSNDIPIMKALQSPTTRTLNAIVANREHFLRLEMEIQSAKAEERALQALVDESESLRGYPMLSAFKGKVAGEMRKMTEQREREEFERSDRPVTATLMLSGGAKAKGITTSLTDDGEMVVATSTSVVTPVALGDEERPTNFYPDRDDEMATTIAEQIVFTLPRDAAGCMLEVVPSTLVTAAEKRKQMALAASTNANRSPYCLDGTLSGTHQQSLEATQILSKNLSRNSRDHIIGRRIDAEPQSLTEMFSAQKSKVAPITKTLKELLAEQRAMEASAQVQRDHYDDRMVKYHTWQDRRLDLLDHFTKLDTQSKNVQ